MTLKCAVLSGGSWGTALAVQLAGRGHEVVLWDRHPDRCEAINRDRRNPRYLRDISLPDNILATPDLGEAVGKAKLVVPVVPSHAYRQVIEGAKPHLGDDAVILSATKGVEKGTLMTMPQVSNEVLGGDAHTRTVMLSGPSFALEVAKRLPTAVVVGGPEQPARFAADALHGDTFRSYHTEDLVGCCIGGALKNVMAIACGVSDGLGFGMNARAALITRGLAEITRLAVAMGANPLTMMGLAGMGDLVLTCTGDLSRNRRVGLALGKGRTLDDILDELGEVAEGVLTAESARELAHRHGVEMPINEQVYALLYEDRPVARALGALLGRARRAERDDGPATGDY